MLYEVVRLDSEMKMGMEMEVGTVGTATIVFYNIGEEDCRAWLPHRRILSFTSQADWLQLIIRAPPMGVLKTARSTIPKGGGPFPTESTSPNRLLTILSAKRQSSLWSFTLNTIVITLGKSNRDQKTIVHLKNIAKTAFLQIIVQRQVKMVQYTYYPSILA